MSQPETSQVNTADAIANAMKLAGVAKDIEYIKTVMDRLEKILNDAKLVFANKEELKAIEVKVTNAATKDELKLLEQQVVSNNARLTNIENGITWVVRIIVGAVVVALMGVILVSK
jgi:sugar/nucleoside kinase (ribokinase family)